MLPKFATPGTNLEFVTCAHANLVQKSSPGLVKPVSRIRSSITMAIMKWQREALHFFDQILTDGKNEMFMSAFYIYHFFPPSSFIYILYEKTFIVLSNYQGNEDVDRNNRRHTRSNEGQRITTKRKNRKTKNISDVSCDSCFGRNVTDNLICTHTPHVPSFRWSELDEICFSSLLIRLLSASFSSPLYIVFLFTFKKFSLQTNSDFY